MENKSAGKMKTDNFVVPTIHFLKTGCSQIDLFYIFRIIAIRNMIFIFNF